VRYQLRTWRFLRYLWDFRITAAGKALLAAIVVSGFFGSASMHVPIYQVFCALVGLYVAAWIASMLARPKLRLAGALPDKAGVGEITSADFTVTNLSRFRPVFDVAIAPVRLPAAIRHVNADEAIPRIAAGESTTIPVRFEPLRRGIYEFYAFRSYSLFPFGLFRNGRARLPARSLLVLPQFHRAVSIDVPVGTRYQPGGIALTSDVGESPEYIGNREYVPGEPAQRIDFRAWARLAKPVVREFQEEYYCRIALILDTHIAGKRREPAAGFPQLEAAISLAASVADVLAGGEYLLDVFAAGPELYVFRAGRHTAHLENVLEILACLEPCRENPFATVAPALADELHNITTAVVIFLDWDDSRRELARTIVESGCRLKVMLVRDGQTSTPLDLPVGSTLAEYRPADIRAGAFEVL
jgi:uncharacterized protein (DUF58 family)